MSLVPWKRCHRGLNHLECNYTYVSHQQIVHVFTEQFTRATRIAVRMGPSIMCIDETHDPFVRPDTYIARGYNKTKYHEIVLKYGLDGYEPFYVAVKQVMRKLPKELELRVYSML